MGKWEKGEEIGENERQGQKKRVAKKPERYISQTKFHYR